MPILLYLLLPILLQEFLAEFMEVAKKQINPDDEFKELVSVFAKDLGVKKEVPKKEEGGAAGGAVSKAVVEAAARKSSIFGHADGSQMVPFVTTGDDYTRNLIHQLRSGRAVGRDGVVSEQMHHSEVTQTLTSLNVLIEMIKAADEESPEALVHRQHVLDEMGASAVAIIMSSCEQDELSRTGIKLAIALLNGGDQEVQKSFFAVMTDPLVDLDAFDGTGNSFVESMRARLRIAAREIRERKVYQQMQSERKEVFEEESAGLSVATVLVMRHDLEAPFPARSHVMEVLELLQLLCEGHNNEMQDFMRVQPGSMSSVDLVAEVYELLVRLEAEVMSMPSL